MKDSILHPVTATCPTCGFQRQLIIFAPVEKIAMQRLCDQCDPPPKEVVSRPMTRADVLLPDLKRPRRPAWYEEKE